jgi:predicted membrane-bound mannosyltransferase
MSAAVVAPPDEQVPKPRRHRRATRDSRWDNPWLIVGLFALLLVVATALRLWQLGASPAWQWDEAVYWRVAVNVQHGVLAEHPVRGSAWTPFLYQPPFYVLLLAGWFDLVGATIYHARVLGVLSIAVTLV